MGDRETINLQCFTLKLDLEKKKLDFILTLGENYGWTLSTVYSHKKVF